MNAGEATKTGAAKGVSSPQRESAKARGRIYKNNRGNRDDSESGGSSQSGVSPRKRLHHNRRDISPLSGQCSDVSQSPAPRRNVNHEHNSSIEDRTPAKRSRTGGGGNGPTPEAGSSANVTGGRAVSRPQSRDSLSSVGDSPAKRRRASGQVHSRVDKVDDGNQGNRRHRSQANNSYRSPSYSRNGNRRGKAAYDAKDRRNSHTGPTKGSVQYTDRNNVASSGMHGDSSRTRSNTHIHNHYQQQADGKRQLEPSLRWNASVHHNDHHTKGRGGQQPHVGITSSTGLHYNNRSTNNTAVVNNNNSPTAVNQRRGGPPPRRGPDGRVVAHTGTHFGGAAGGAVGRGRGRPPLSGNKSVAGDGVKSVNRVETCPFLLRVFCRVNDHHDVSEFSTDGGVPVSSELQIYTWMDATLREVADLIKDVSPEARDRRATLDFKVVQPDRTGNHVMIGLGSVHSTRTDIQDKTMLLNTKYRIGDYLDLAILLPRRVNYRADGSARTGAESDDKIRPQSNEDESIIGDVDYTHEDAHDQHGTDDENTATEFVDADSQPHQSPRRQMLDGDDVRYRRDSVNSDNGRIVCTGNTTDDKHENPRSSRCVLITDKSAVEDPTTSSTNNSGRTSRETITGGTKGVTKSGDSAVVDKDSAVADDEQSRISRRNNCGKDGTAATNIDSTVDSKSGNSSTGDNDESFEDVEEEVAALKNDDGSSKGPAVHHNSTPCVGSADQDEDTKETAAVTTAAVVDVKM